MVSFYIVIPYYISILGESATIVTTIYYCHHSTVVTEEQRYAKLVFLADQNVDVPFCCWDFFQKAC